MHRCDQAAEALHCREPVALLQQSELAPIGLRCPRESRSRAMRMCSSGFGKRMPSDAEIERVQAATLRCAAVSARRSSFDRLDCSAELFASRRVGLARGADVYVCFTRTGSLQVLRIPCALLPAQAST